MTLTDKQRLDRVEARNEHLEREVRTLRQDVRMLGLLLRDHQGAKPHLEAIIARDFQQREEVAA